jgi:hypothetical protein
VAADAPLGADAPLARPRAATHPRALRLAPPVRRPRGAWGDAAFATTLAATLAAGIVGVLLLNTAMQTQADRIATMRTRLAALSLQLQSTQTALDRDNAPSELAARAWELSMRPAREMPILRPSVRTPRRLPAAAKLSARGRAARTSRGG